MITLRPQAAAASATALRRLTFDAKVVTTTRPGASSIKRCRFVATSFSEGLSPSRRMLVESHTSASTPSSPIAVSRAASVGGPMVGVGSIFQSPE